MKEKLLGMTLEELRAAASGCGLKPFVGGQLADWLYAKRAASWERMTNIGKDARARLQERYDLGVSAPVGVAESSDGTRKYLFPVGGAGPERVRLRGDAEDVRIVAVGGAGPERVRLRDEPEASQNVVAKDRATSVGERAVESVMIPDDDRRTLCVSSQAGCKMGCRFCMTGRQGWHGNLDAADILNQFLSVDESAELTNAVFMGMGEPLDNYDAVRRAIEVLTAPWGFGWSPKRITLSTIGVLPSLKRFLDETRCHLAVSLHNPFPEERFGMMPVEKAWHVRDVIALIRKYDFSGQRRVSFEYTMFDGWNDDTRHSDALCRLLEGLECRVNLIRFHRIPDFPYDCARPEAMEAFRDRLNARGVTCTIRASRGEDILAACGMLAGKHGDTLLFPAAK